MGLRQRAWARCWRDYMVKELGGECCDCHRKPPEVKFEFDCIVPQGDAHHKMEWSQRITFYKRQFCEGNLALRCEECHVIKTKNENSQLVLEMT